MWKRKYQYKLSSVQNIVLQAHVRDLLWTSYSILERLLSNLRCYPVSKYVTSSCKGHILIYYWDYIFFKKYLIQKSSCVHLFVCSSFFRSFIRSFVCSFFRWHVRSCVRSFVCSFFRWYVSSFILSFLPQSTHITRLCVQSVIH